MLCSVSISQRWVGVYCSGYCLPEMVGCELCRVCYSYGLACVVQDKCYSEVYCLSVCYALFRQPEVDWLLVGISQRVDVVQSWCTP